MYMLIVSVLKIVPVKVTICFVLLMLGSGIPLYLPQNSNATSVSVPLGSNFLSSGLSDQNIGFSRQVSVTDNSGNPIIGQFQSVQGSFQSNCLNTQATVFVTKQGNNQGNPIQILSISGGSSSVVASLNLANGETGHGCINNGNGFQVVELGLAPITTDGCSASSVSSGNEIFCRVINTGSTQGTQFPLNADGRSEFPGISGLTPTSTPGQESAVTVGSLAEAGGPTTPQSTATQTRPFNPPTGTCTDIQTQTTPAVTIRKPSSMKIVINGKVDLSKVQDALSDLRTNTFHVAVTSDLKSNDGISASISNPQFMGYIVVQDKKGLQQEIIKYNILDFRRECTFITLAEAAGPATNANVAPLGELGDPERAKLEPSEIDKLLLGGEQVTGGTPKDESLVFNPPFSGCLVDTTTNPPVLGDNFAIYNIRGEIDRKSDALNEDNLLIQATIDLNQRDTDLAKLVDNNNPLMHVDLLTQENKDRVDKISFSLSDVWTDCKQIALSTETVFEPFDNELNY
jgi:hypothetical protein